MKFADDALSWKFFAAGGPGGQHVNKVATAAMLHVEVARLGLAEAVVERLAGKMSKDGFIVIVAKRYKSQEQNRADALERLAAMVLRAKTVPKKRRATKPTRRVESGGWKARRCGVGLRQGGGWFPVIRQKNPGSL